MLLHGYRAESWQLQHNAVERTCMLANTHANHPSISIPADSSAIVRSEGARH